MDCSFCGSRSGRGIGLGADWHAGLERTEIPISVDRDIYSSTARDRCNRSHPAPGTARRCWQFLPRSEPRLALSFNRHNTGPRYIVIDSRYLSHTNRCVLDNRHIRHLPALHRGIFCLWHYPVMGRPLARTGYGRPLTRRNETKTETTSQHGNSVWDVTRVQLMTCATV